MTATSGSVDAGSVGASAVGVSAVGVSAVDAGALFRLEPEALRCPFPIFEQFREKAPVQWEPAIEAFVVSRYDDIISVTKRPEVFSSRLNLGPVLDRQMREIIGVLVEEEPVVAAQVARAARLHEGFLVNSDPPAHSRQRRLVDKAFSVRRVKAMEDELVGIVDGLIDAFDTSGVVELNSQLGSPLPLTVIANALGVPVAKMDDFKRWSDDFVRIMGNHSLGKDDLSIVMRSQGEFYDYFDAQIADRRANPRDDLTTEIVQASIDGEALSDAEMLEAFTQILVAGNETTTKLIAGCLLRLARDPDYADHLRANRGEIPGFVEEVVRLEAPVQGLFRTATEDTEIGGVAIPAGSALWLVYASGNRDAARFDQPDDVCPARRPNPPHLSFGNGEHYCLGANLARAEARITIDRLLTRFSTITTPIDDDHDLHYETSYLVHGLHALPLNLTP